jgi:hypothetical protein
MRRELWWSMALFLCLVALPASAQGPASVPSEPSGQAPWGHELDAGQSPQELAFVASVTGDPVVSAALQAFQGQYGVSCNLTEVSREGFEEVGGTFFALFTCLANEEGMADTRGVQVRGWWNVHGLGVDSLTFSAAE